MVQYIVVGGGSAGCVIAARLSEDTQASVVLLEEGPRDTHPFIHLPVGFYKTSQGNLVERYPWEPPAGYIGAPNPTMVQARVLGGGSSVNAMVYLRGQPADYDSWADGGARGWAYKDVLPFFKKCESNDRFSNDAHGTDGPLGVCDQRFTHPLTKLWLQACQQAGLAYNADFNSGVQDGCGLYQINARNGLRSSTSVAYLKPARRRPNLTVRTHCRVLRILVENGRATGVEYLEKNRRHVLRADREVIVSAGAINTPKLLMLSGIGPASHLHDKGVKVIHDLPGVGQNLQDHIEVSLINELRRPLSYDKYKKPHWKIAAGLQYALFRQGPVTSNVVEGGAFWRTSLAENRADAQYCFMAGAGVEDGVGSVPGGNGCTLNVCQTRPRSSGFLQLHSADPMDLPRIEPNYLTDPLDVECMAQATEFGRHIMSQAALAGHIQREHVPAEPLRTGDDYRRFVRRHAHAALHPVGTCKMGTDAMAVVNNDLRVHGIDGLRIADNSIAPSLCSSNTNALAIMIGEKAADHIQRADQSL
ncbi:choline dehydrogenase-like flavoprotein [Pseudomonas sp. GM33]|jgi:choline dehydrogenase-like flavoprotein|uniref:GMC family oxidoreductase n=1 Tax=unclassified Pseudomonas TaxID=196821 RepID=UPI000270233E|nr:MULTISPECIES: GMC family oxidoreductase N-terminal domain-containing protein [unclassified Pseudomonas]EJM42593.1 choline dehydrogenase-like flavoprotein [Pseudomonas sp. GM33]MBV7569390.1 GMC family oxidoreductase N-terminal domain-containing protein [Pseudomonas sp. PDM27]MBV7575182.1 GMC family oxidoreductase N-terminal domain-containing protein [Pseudomonas sp. PDM32]